MSKDNKKTETEQCTIQSVVGQSEQLKCVWCGNDESKDILPQLCNECFKKGCKAF
jgi:primosomal protein N'